MNQRTDSLKKVKPYRYSTSSTSLRWIDEIRDDKGNIATETSDMHRTIKLLQAISQQQIGRLKRNGEIFRQIQFTKTGLWSN